MPADIMRCLLFAAAMLMLGASTAADVAPPSYSVPLWAYSDEDNTVFLLGSLHALRPEDHPLPASVDRAFNLADRLVLEVDMSRVSPGEAAAVSRAYGQFRESEGNLSGALSSRTRKLLVDYLAARGDTIARFERMKPWMVSIQLGLQEISRLGYDPRLGVDAFLMQRALESGKPIGQLETFEQQLRLLSSDPLPVQDLALRVSLERAGGFAGELQALIEAWKAADIESLYDIGIAGADEYPALSPQLDRLIADRNETMATGIRQLIEGDENALVVVGAMHLGGDRGILSLLADSYPFGRVKKP